METEICFALLTLELDLTWPQSASMCVVLRASVIYTATVHTRVVDARAGVRS